MKHDSYEMSLLFDYYGETLTDKQQLFFDLYYNQDLSLGEIAENEGISRQGVRDAIVRAESAMRQLEEKTGCIARARRMHEALAAIVQNAAALAQSADPAARKIGQSICTIATNLKE